MKLQRGDIQKSIDLLKDRIGEMNIEMGINELVLKSLEKEIEKYPAPAKNVKESISG